MALRDRAGHAMCVNAFGEVARQTGRYDQALAHYRDFLATMEKLEHQSAAASALVMAAAKSVSCEASTGVKRSRNALSAHRLLQQLSVIPPSWMSGWSWPEPYKRPPTILMQPQNAPMAS